MAIEWVEQYPECMWYYSMFPPHTPKMNVSCNLCYLYAMMPEVGPVYYEWIDSGRRCSPNIRHTYIWLSLKAEPLLWLLSTRECHSNIHMILSQKPLKMCTMVVWLSVNLGGGTRVSIVLQQLNNFLLSVLTFLELHFCWSLLWISYHLL